MLTPIEEAIFKNNPEFERLYKTLTASLLNPDGSTKNNDAVAKKRDAIREELRAHRLKATKRYLLRRAVTAAAAAVPEPSSETPSEQLQPPLRGTRSGLQPRHQQQASNSSPTLETSDLLLLLPPFLSQADTLVSSSLALLLSRPPFSDLGTQLPQLTAIISATLASQASGLARVLHPNTNPSYIHRCVPSLASTVSTLQSSIAESARLLCHARLRVTRDLALYLRQRARILAQLVRLLEAKHGPAARSAELRAEEAGLEARTWATAAEALLWDARRTIYPPEAQRALANYKRHLAVARMRLTDARRARATELEDYGVSVVSSEEGGKAGLGIVSGDRNKERKMREMARVWREMEARLQEVKGDLDRLW
ncbi:hypothetical protein AAE478_006353 [Parahypoxylon ruwenzoriense]